ncbi:XK-related protein 6-like [Diadema antillarum]|uniref:XK-related protein 6-like n=1 Tax=Diadema antillarum TaxID=105358 RepID=UPI003A897B81
MTTDNTDIGDSTNALRKTPSRELELEYPTPQENGNSAPPESRDRVQSDSSETTKVEESGGTGCFTCIKEGRFTTFDVVFILGGMIMYVADLVTDLLVGVQYFRGDYFLWGIMTFIFVLLPSLVLQYFSFRWFVSDLEEDSNHQNKGFGKKLLCWCDWLATHVLQLGALKRYWRTLKFGLRSRKEKKYYRMMIYEYRDITMLRLLEAFMESAPQLVLQVYIMVETEELYWLTAASALVSLSSLAWALEAYHKALRDSRTDRKNITYVAVALRMAWRLFTITSRVIAMALFAAIYEWWVFVVAGAHWLVITVWLVWQETTFCDTKFEEVLFDCVMGFIHIFCFFNVKEGATRYRALLFYTVIFVENTVMFGLWYSYQDSREQMYGLPALVFVWGGFFLGIFLMAFYYRFCHPNGQLPYCISPTCGGESPDTEPSDEIDGAISLRATQTPQMSVSELPPSRVNLFSYKCRRKVHPHLLLGPKHKIVSSIVLKPPRSTQVPAPKTQPEIIDTYAVRLVNGEVTTQTVSENTL